MIEKFFNEYFDEVMDHLNYEEQVAFPYFSNICGHNIRKGDTSYSAEEYGSHHTDIEMKLADLKNLLLKHIKIAGDINIKRKFLYSLFELEYDLMIHSVIEERVLIPIVETIEASYN
ncbi:MAG: hypothetical protein R2771_01600 [Saprospiraceae bacterium]